MRIVCAWCGEVLGDTHSSPQGTTHGLCGPCDRQLRAVELPRAASGDADDAGCPSLRELIAELRAQPT